MKLFDLQRSPNCLKVRILARELSLPLEVIPMDLPGLKAPNYLELNPSGKVPTLVDDDHFTLWESGAILVYLAQQQPDLGLFPADPRGQAEVLRWMFFSATHLQPWLSILGQERLLAPRIGRQPDATAIAVAERDLARFVPIVEEHLSSHKYLTGSYSIADIAAGGGFEECEARGLSLAPYPAIRDWRERLRQRPAWKD